MLVRLWSILFNDTKKKNLKPTAHTHTHSGDRCCFSSNSILKKEVYNLV